MRLDAFHYRHRTSSSFASLVQRERASSCWRAPSGKKAGIHGGASPLNPATFQPPDGVAAFYLPELILVNQPCNDNTSSLAAEVVGSPVYVRLTD